MDFADKYVRRLNYSGVNFSESYKNQSKRILTEEIRQSPDCKYVKLNNSIELTPCIVRDLDGFVKRKFSFIPDTVINIGDYIYQDQDVYIGIEQNKDDITPYLETRLCNATFPIKTESSYDYFRDDQGNIVHDDVTNEPILIPIENTDINLPCVVENKYRVSDKSEQMWVADNDITVILPYHADIKMGNTFEMYGDIYKIVNIDFTKVINGVGILTLRGEKEK